MKGSEGAEWARASARMSARVMRARRKRDARIVNNRMREDGAEDPGRVQRRSRVRRLDEVPHASHVDNGERGQCAIKEPEKSEQ